MSNSSDLWTFIVDTDKYSGNFEREMCAFMTGRVGECGCGDDLAALFFEETGNNPDEPHEVNPHIVEQPDDHGCYRPCSIHPTPGFFNDGFGGEYPDSILDTPEGEQEVRDRIIAKCEEYIQREMTGVPHTDHWQKVIDEAKESISKYPSYQSVAIFMNRRPTDEEVVVLIERAKGFLAASRKLDKDTDRGYISHEDINVLGFRLVKEMTTGTLDQAWSATGENE